jgi:flagellar biosynthetic protein FliR
VSAELLAALPGFLLAIVRTGAFFAAMPVFGVARDSRMLRLVLAVALGASFHANAPAPVELHGGLPDLLLLGVREAGIGLLAGFAVGLISAAMSAAGELISHEMGFSMATIVDPETGQTNPVVAQLLEVVAFLLIFTLDLHHEVLRVLGATWAYVPTGAPVDLDAVALRLGELGSLALSFALRYALPVLGVMVLTTAALVMLSRAVPNINLLEFSFGARILLALSASIWFLAEGQEFLVAAFEGMLGRAAALFAPV